VDDDCGNTHEDLSSHVDDQTEGRCPDRATDRYILGTYIRYQSGSEMFRGSCRKYMQ
jgi:hypothetical protein